MQNKYKAFVPPFGDSCLIQACDGCSTREQGFRDDYQLAVVSLTGLVPFGDRFDLGEKSAVSA